MLAITTNITINSLKLQKSLKSIDINKTNSNFLAIKFAKNIKYFNSIYKNSNNISIINVDCYIFYQNVFIFVNRLKNIAKMFVEKYCVKKLVSKYLYNSNLI